VANVGPLEILVVLIIALVVFGPKRIPELGQSLGKGIREFKASLDGDDEQSQKAKPGTVLDGAESRASAANPGAADVETSPEARP
jgi:sec-independent protein translocase protein TatA